MFSEDSHDFQGCQSCMEGCNGHPAGCPDCGCVLPQCYCGHSYDHHSGSMGCVGQDENGKDCECFSYKDEPSRADIDARFAEYPR